MDKIDEYINNYISIDEDSKKKELKNLITKLNKLKENENIYFNQIEVISKKLNLIQIKNNDLHNENILLKKKILDNEKNFYRSISEKIDDKNKLKQEIKLLNCNLNNLINKQNSLKKDYYLKLGLMFFTFGSGIIYLYNKSSNHFC